MRIRIEMMIDSVDMAALALRHGADAAHRSKWTDEEVRSYAVASETICAMAYQEIQKVLRRIEADSGAWS
jgi:hypothetical protein